MALRAGGLALAGMLPVGFAQGADAAPAPCRVDGLRHEVLCGRVARPLDPEQPTGRRIDVHYVVVPAATAVNKRLDPVFFFAGGPGQSAIALAGRVLPLLQRLNNRRDIVFIDQRGTGRSAPLKCASDESLPLADRLDPGRAIARLHACRTGLQALPHGDLRFYTTAIATADAQAVRAALGAPQINLVGGSYGSRAALDYLRQFPGQVRRVVLDGVAPPDMVLPQSLAADAAAALEALFAACEQDAACRSRHPQLAARWAALLAALPLRMSALDPATGTASVVTLNRETVAAAVRGPLYAPALAAALPFAIDEALAGRAAPLIGLAGALTGGARALEPAEGMHFSVICAEDMPPLDARHARAAAVAAPQASGASEGAGALSASTTPTEPETLAAVPDAAEPGASLHAFSEAFVRPYREVCADWPRGTVPPAFYTLPRSASPVLAFSGTLDPVTPPRHGERVVRALGATSAGGKARHVVAGNVGHGVFSVECTRELLTTFIDADTEAEALSVDASCLNGLPRPPAFEPPTPEPAA